MKKIAGIGTVLVLLTAVWAFRSFEGGLKIGDNAPKASEMMKGIDGKTYSLSSVKGENGLLVIFSCNTCPFVLATQDRYREIQTLAKAKNIGLIIINSNEAQRDGVDSEEAMKKFAEENAYVCPYVTDVNSVMADAFGASKTPDIFLFNKDLKLVYKGAIDDSHREPSGVKETFLKNAMTNLVNNTAISPETTSSVGCTIKRK